MKNILLFVLVFSSVGTLRNGAFAQSTKVQPAKPASNAKIQFAEARHEFGDLVQGATVRHEFEFTNTGTDPLLLLNVQTTCGCTATDWSKTPIAPGEGGKISVAFNSTNKIGRQNKIITVFSNAINQEEKLKIVANVLPPPDPASNPGVPISPPK